MVCINSKVYPQSHIVTYSYHQCQLSIKYIKATQSIPYKLFSPFNSPNPDCFTQLLIEIITLEAKFLYTPKSNTPLRARKQC